MASRLVGFPLALVLVACSGAATPTTIVVDPSTTAQAPATAAPAPTTTSSVPTTTEAPRRFEGAVITVVGPGESQTVLPFPEVFAAFSDASGAIIRYVSHDEPVTAVLGGSEADLVVTGRAEWLAPLAEEGLLRDLPDGIETDVLATATVDGIAEYLTLGDSIVAVPFEVVPKSLLWHAAAEPPTDRAFTPESIDDMIATTTAVSPDAPTWCLGVEAGPATGWVLTDWLEDLLLHMGGPEPYRSFIAGELPFTSDEIRAAARAMEELLAAEGAVRGGLQSAAALSIFSAANPMATSPPGCWFTHQASFQLAFFSASGIAPDELVGVLGTPGPAVDDTLLIASVATVALVSDEPAAAALLEHMVDPASATERFRAGWVFSPWVGIDASVYPDRAPTRAIAELIAGATLFPDASDGYPRTLEAAFRRELVAWADGSQALDAALDAIETVRVGAVD